MSNLFSAKDHDLSLPDWGPYSKQYIGMSHIADRERGLRFDVSLFPALYRRRIDVPNVCWESGFHPWECAPNFEYVSYRHELVWKDQLYADVAYGQIDGLSGRLVRCEFVNDMDLPYSVALHTMASMQFPTTSGHASHPVWFELPELPAGATLIHPLDYQSLDFVVPTEHDCLTWDGGWRGEVRGDGFLNGSGLGDFGRDVGDRVVYPFAEVSGGPHKLVVRARLREPGHTVIALNGMACGEFTVESTDFVEIEIVPDAVCAAEALVLTAQGNTPIDIAFLALVPADAPALTIRRKEWTAAPVRSAGPVEESLILKYEDAAQHYGIAWSGADYEIRQVLSRELDSYLRLMTHDHVNETLTHDAGGHFTNVMQRPVLVPAKSRRVLWGYVCEGDEVTVREQLQKFANASDQWESWMRQARERAFRFDCSPAGEPYAFSQQRMATTTLTNIVFPTYTQRQYIRHRCPGRWWDSLYTWDSGFIGLGLMEIDPEQAEECLAQYLTEPGNPHAAFIHHGSFMPVQIYLYQEIWNRSQSHEFLERHYDAIRQYYLFLVGRDQRSTTNELGSGLLSTWEYFYNSGGWDDYASQVAMHRQDIAASTTSAVISAQAVRAARILSEAARELGRTEDLAIYEADIHELSAALNQHSWDADAGYYSYVRHDGEGQPVGFFRDADGVNYNMGLDGAHPLTAGVCDAEQEATLIERLFDPERLWTDVGLTTVDQSAPYYRSDGYWNGTVWFPHQWFFWKTMLDLGRSAHAYQIARQALDTWKREVDESYLCFEHFPVESGRGSGWHQFSGLSTPVLAFFAAFYCPGRLTVGFDTWIQASQFSAGSHELRAQLRLRADTVHPRRTVWVTLAADADYSVRWSGESVSKNTLHPGLLSIDLPATGEPGVLEVSPIAL
ncbi:MAG: hypothetical protein CML13_03935 [Puniceicoccaceae bacterium]|nr:hypothetical protein [Puniceicoccaceae bacterium]|tara:strand:- start:6497 stop:9196 length:2700 start_codon:yes stop_codon:yes gene_type:complete